MVSTQVDMDFELKNMIMCFRVSELQVLLGHAGKNKSGRKHELLTRALQLIRSPDCNKSIQAKVIDLYAQRYPRQAVQLKRKANFSCSPTKMDILNSITPRKHNSCPPQPLPIHHHRDKYLDVKFKPLPFYEHLAEILPPVPLESKSDRPFQETTFKFHISQQQAALIYSSKTKASKSLKQDTQIQLRFCELDTSSEQNDKLPPGLHVKVNSDSVTLPPFIPPTKAGVEPRRINQPLDITPYCYTSRFHEFILEVRWSPGSYKLSPTKYALTINLVEQQGVSDLLHTLQQTSINNTSTSKKLVQGKFSNNLESDIKTTSLKVSLLCPLGKMRMTLPTRPSTCRHLQCFDASLFLMMNEKKPTWICPVCDGSADFSALRIDRLFEEILRSCTTDEIEFTEDGNWHSAKLKTDTVIIGTTPQKPIGKAVTAERIGGRTSQHVKEGAGRNKPCNSKQARKQALMPLRNTSENSLNLSQTGGNETDNKSKVVDVIDLTCDSSDDESTSKSPTRDTEDVSVVPYSPINLVHPSYKNDSKLDVSATMSPHRRSSKPYASPSRSPCRSNSPYHRSSQPTARHLPFSPMPPSEPSPRSTPPLKQSLITSHMPRYNRKGTLDTPPSSQILPSSVSSGATPPPTNGYIPSIPRLDLGLDSYQSAHSSLPEAPQRLGFSQHLDFYTRQLLHPLRPPPTIPPFYFNPFPPVVPPFGLPIRSTQTSAEDLTSDHNRTIARRTNHDENEHYSDPFLPVD